MNDRREKDHRGPAAARLLARLLPPEDRTVAAALAPLFLGTAVASTLAASGAKAMFLAQTPIGVLPLVVMAQAVWGITTALAWLHAMGRFDLGRRSVALLATFLGTAVLLRCALPLHPPLVSLATAVLAPGLAQLAMLQAWALPAGLLPSRQVKRLVPLLAATSTVGAAAGGALARVGGLAADDLVVLAAAIAFLPALWLPRRIADLRRLAPPPAARAPDDPAEGVRQGLRDIAGSPLLRRLAIIVALSQFASVLLDYQLSAELKLRYDKAGLAAFLGTFYWIGNLGVLAVSLLATQGLVRVLGLGVCITGVAVMVGTGGLATLVVATGQVGALTVFPVLVAAAGAERVGQFALTRSATQMLLAPLEPRLGERARTLIEGVFYRLAAILAAAGLLATSALPSLWLSVPLVVACGVVVATGLTVAAPYRRALFEALRTGRLGAGAGHTSVGVDRTVTREIAQALRGADEDRQVQALALVRALEVPVDARLLRSLALSGRPATAVAALDAMRALAQPVTAEVLGPLLAPDRPAETLRVALTHVPAGADEDLLTRVRALRQHPDPTVAALSRVADEAHNALSLGATPSLNTLVAPEHDVESRRRLVDALGQGAPSAGLRPLLDALAEPTLRSSAVNALARYGRRLVEAAKPRLVQPGLDTGVRGALLHALSHSEEPAAVDLLREAAVSPDPAIADAGVRGLLHLAQTPGLRPETRWLSEAARHEMVRLGALTAGLGEPLAGERAALVRRTLTDQRARAERRLFSLLGLLHGRAPLHRAFCHLHSPNPRARSNALELLEQAVRRGPLGALVPLLERGAVAGLPVDEMARSLAANPVVARTRDWAAGRPDPTLDAALALGGVKLLRQAPTEALLALAPLLDHEIVPAGASWRSQRHAVLVLAGRGHEHHRGVNVGPGDDVAWDAVLAEAPPFVELEALGDRTAPPARTTGELHLAVLTAARLHGLLSDQPLLVRWLLAETGARWRARMEADHDGTRLAGTLPPGPWPPAITPGGRV